jgi:predicted HAD superfamily phosphohydrolase YqeG
MDFDTAALTVEELQVVVNEADHLGMIGDFLNADVLAACRTEHCS